MVTYLKDKIIDKAVNDAAIANDRVLVYKTATSTFVFEDQSAVAAINDLTDVVISGVPADNEVLAYNTATSKWINQTAAEAGLATTTDLASYLALAGGTMAGDLDMADHAIINVDDIKAYDGLGIYGKDFSGNVMIHLASSTYAFKAAANASMNTSYKIVDMADPTLAQDAATKNYADTRVATKELVTNFTNDYVLVYKTASGKFEMEEQSAALGLPVVDTTAIIKGSADGTKKVRFEVDGLTSGTTRIMTVPDKDMTLCGTDEVMLLSGANAMAGALNMAGNWITGLNNVRSQSASNYLNLVGGDNVLYNSQILIEGNAYGSTPGTIRFIASTGTSGTIDAVDIAGNTLTPKVTIYHGLDMNSKAIIDMKNSAASALSGTQKDIEIDIGGTAYYFTVYPTKA